MEVKTRGPGYTHKIGNLHATRPYIGLNFNTTFTSLDGYDFEFTECHSIPHFRRKVREGALLPHLPFQQLKVHSASHISNFEKWKTYSSSDIEHAWGDGWVGELPSTTNIPVSSELLGFCNSRNPEQIIAQALAALYSRNWDGLTFVAEFRKTVGLFRQSFRRLIDLGRMLIRGKVGFGFSLSSLPSKGFAGYLEYRYAWRTLLFDLESLSKAIEDMKEADRSCYTERKGLSFTIHDVKTYPIGVVGEYSSVYTRTVDAQLSLRGSVSSKFRPSTVLANPFMTVWELIPFSFIVDWFIGVGTAIQAISGSFVNSERATSWGGYISGTVSGSNSPPVLTSSRWDSITLTSSFDCQFEYAVRVPAEPSYLPRLQWRLDDFKVLDLIAIWYQLVNRR